MIQVFREHKRKERKEGAAAYNKYNYEFRMLKLCCEFCKAIQINREERGFNV